MLYSHNSLGRATVRQKWTDLALHCYMRRCSCTGCLYSYILKSSKCQMKAAVLELIRTKNFPKYEIIKKEDGTTEFHIIGNHLEGRQRNKEKIYSKFRNYLSNEIINVLESIDARIQCKLVAGLFLTGLSREEVCSVIEKPRVDINNAMTSMYFRTQAEVQYKTKHNKLGEFVAYYGRRVNEQKNFNCN